MTAKTVVVTGFGLFRDYEVNASWEVARALPGTGIAEQLNVNLVTTLVPVSYTDVDRIVPKLWDQHRPSVSSVRSPRDNVSEPGWRGRLVGFS